MATITLAYTVAQGVRPIPALTARVAAVQLLAQGELSMLGMSIDSDTTLGGVSSVTRTIVLGVNPDGEARFPTDAEKIAATQNICRGQLSVQVPAKGVSSATPVVTP